MTDNANFAVYRAFGLTIRSSIPMWELPQLKVNVEGIDVVIEIADLSKLWCALVPAGKKSIVSNNLYMFQVADVARFCVLSGNKIIVSPLRGFDDDRISLYLLGTCMGALLMQRKILPLHGSALVINGKAYGFIGLSGAGKSTLASALLKSGYQLLSDDVIAVSLSHGNTPMITPSYPQQKLWQESLKELGMGETYRPIFNRETKFAVPVSAEFSAEPVPLAGVFELVKSEDEKIKIHRVQRLERLQTLFRHTYRNSLISRFRLLEWHFRMSVAIANQIEIFQLRRPKYGFTAFDLAHQVMDVLNKEG